MTLFSVVGTIEISPLRANGNWSSLGTHIWEHMRIMVLFPVFYALIHAAEVLSFHIPDLSVRTDVGLDSNIINSNLEQNWSQSLNVGSASLVGMLIILFVCLFAYVRLQAQITQQQRCLFSLKDEFQCFKDEKSARPKGRSASAF